MRQPLNYLIALLLGAAVAVGITGGTELELLGKTVSLRTPKNLLFLAYALAFVQGVRWWLREGRGVIAGWPSAYRTLLFWHGLPVALWFLWPNRLSFFFWFMGPTNAERTAVPGLGTSLTNYWQALQVDYSLRLAAAIGAVALAGGALLLVRRLQPGTVAIAALVVFGATATLLHPNQKPRFLHTWLPTLWVLASATVAWLVCRPWIQRRTWLSWALGGVLVAGAAALILHQSLNPGHAQEQKPYGPQASTLALSEFYLAELVDGERPAFLANVPMRFFFEWSWLEHSGRVVPYDIEIKGLGQDPAAARQVFEQWLHSTPCDAIVFVDMPLGEHQSKFSESWPYHPLRLWLPQQQAFRLAAQRHFPAQGCTVSVWKRS